MKGKIALAFTGALASALFAATPALADDSKQVTSPDGAARVSYHAEGDTFWLYDLKCDGQGVRYEYHIPSTGEAGGDTFNGGCGESKKFGHNVSDDRLIEVCVHRQGGQWGCMTHHT
jgi:hypothetical protein